MTTALLEPPVIKKIQKLREEKEEQAEPEIEPPISPPPEQTPTETQEYRIVPGDQQPKQRTTPLSKEEPKTQTTWVSLGIDLPPPEITRRRDTEESGGIEDYLPTHEEWQRSGAKQSYPEFLKEIILKQISRQPNGRVSILKLPDSIPQCLIPKILDALPTKEELQEMSPEEKDADYKRTFQKLVSEIFPKPGIRIRERREIIYALKRVYTPGEQYERGRSFLEEVLGVPSPELKKQEDLVGAEECKEIIPLPKEEPKTLPKPTQSPPPQKRKTPPYQWHGKLYGPTLLPREMREEVVAIIERLIPGRKLDPFENRLKRLDFNTATELAVRACEEFDYTKFRLNGRAREPTRKESSTATDYFFKVFGEYSKNGNGKPS